MKTVSQILMTVLLLLCGVALAQQSGTINTVTVNPRENQELTCSTGTESGQPSDTVPCSGSEPNGLVPVTSNMVGSGSNGNMNQAPAQPERQNATSPAKTAEQTPAARKDKRNNAKAQK
jgi:hypothetical protein